MSAYAEERRYKRRVPPFDIKVICVHFTDYDGRIINLSEGGVCVQSTVKVNEGQKLTVNFLLPSNAKNETLPIFAIGEVIWLKVDSKIKGQKTINKYGVKFQAILAEHQVVIRQFIEATSDEKPVN